MGLTSSRLGGMEYHNLGNYAIMEPFIIYLQKTFPNSQISTSIQMSDDFCEKFNINSLHDKRFWTYEFKTAFETAKDIMKISLWKSMGFISEEKFQFFIKNSTLLREINNSDLIIDFSGDVYGDNANFRQFLEANTEIIFAKMLNKPVVSLIGSPGPFKPKWRRLLAKNVMNQVDLITNREAISTEKLKHIGVNQDKVITTACPAFLFEARKERDVQEVLEREGVLPKNKPLVGMIICGWNMPKPPFSKVPREEEELIPFAQFINFILSNYDVNLLLMSHQNRTDENGNLIRGNDHAIISQLSKILEKKYNCMDRVITLNGLYDAATSKAIIGCCDVLISGRIHGAVGGLSQCIPTMIIDYGHEPKAHKLNGFAQLIGIEEYVSDPNDPDDMITKFTKMWNNQNDIKQHLNVKIPEIKEKAKHNFTLLHDVVESNTYK